LDRQLCLGGPSRPARVLRDGARPASAGGHRQARLAAVLPPRAARGRRGWPPGGPRRPPPPPPGGPSVSSRPPPPPRFSPPGGPTRTPPLGAATPASGLRRVRRTRAGGMASTNSSVEPSRRATRPARELSARAIATRPTSTSRRLT